MRIAVAGGKGGTGKTLVAVCLTEYLASKNTYLLDADVEEPDAALFFHSTPEQLNDVNCTVPEIDFNKCTYCGYCSQICQFNALVVMPGEVLFFPELCHSCLACYYLCPQACISRSQHLVGKNTETLLSNGSILLAGRLRIGEPRAVPVINAVKKQNPGAEWEIIDCPPGTSCSLMAAIKDTDFCLLVTEPTPFGRHDLALALEAARLMKVPAGIIINRWQGKDSGIDHLATKKGIPVMARIPYNLELAQLYAQGENPQRALPWVNDLMEEIVEAIKGAWA
ncbi:MAG: 4Fe-4S binding protein [Syntrophomonas sp.]